MEASIKSPDCEGTKFEISKNCVGELNSSPVSELQSGEVPVAKEKIRNEQIH